MVLLLMTMRGGFASALRSFSALEASARLTCESGSKSLVSTTTSDPSAAASLTCAGGRAAGGGEAGGFAGAPGVGAAPGAFAAAGAALDSASLLRGAAAFVLPAAAGARS